ncbi:CHAD domain-containing protein [Candidatus Solirubrobacter pratensis]|uniref:CHAD domain-containing protein n=1 Tax=Candidatus Solirubrobacter pratensis TaxID=1298857 RepID=UPI00041A1B5B|nr:CHAD domain-containing protein [Candidatus Solirubrobacter pratensis]
MPAYLLPDGLDLGDALASHFNLHAEPARTSRWTFYDTFDGRLHAAGLILRHGDRELVLLDRASGAETVRASVPDAPERLFARDLPGALRARLAGNVEMRALTPAARVSVRSRRLAVLNEDEKVVVRLSLQEPAGLRSRVCAAPVRGYDKDLERVERVLGRSLGLARADEPLADEAIAAAGALPSGTSSKLDVALIRRQPAGAAAEAVLARTHAIAEANLPGTLADVDSEFLHDLRVAVRRARSLLRQLKAVFPEGALEHLREELKRIQQITGETRDLDVQLLDFEDYADRDALAPLNAVLAAHRARALAAMKRALGSKRTAGALQAWAGLGALEDTPPIELLAGERIVKVYRRMVRMGEAIGDDSPHEALHDLRKVGKELRYLLEFFGGLFPAEEVKPMIKALKGLQDVLGRFQDFEVQADTLRALTAEVGAQPGGPEGLLAMGALIDRLGRDQHRARTEFAAQFGEFAAAPRRAAVKRTFG